MGSSGEIGSRDLWLLPLTEASLAGAGDAAGEPRDFLATSFDEWDPMLSPDARHVAYTSNESGRAEIYVMPYPGPGAKSLISRGGGTWPRWNRNGRELFYLSAADELMSVAVETELVFRPSAPRALFRMPPFVAGRVWPYDVAPDGTRFLVRRISAAGAQQATELRIVVNWIEELERNGWSGSTR